MRVDVLVTDGRNPVAGLTAGDFELRVLMAAMWSHVR